MRASPFSSIVDHRHLCVWAGISPLPGAVWGCRCIYTVALKPYENSVDSLINFKRNCKEPKKPTKTNVTVITKRKTLEVYSPWPADHSFFGTRPYKTFLVYGSLFLLLSMMNWIFLKPPSSLWKNCGRISVFMLSDFEFGILQILGTPSVMESLSHICEWVLY